MWLACFSTCWQRYSNNALWASDQVAVSKRRRHVVPSSCSWLMHSGSSPFDAAAGVQAVVECHFGLLCCATRGPARNF